MKARDAGIFVIKKLILISVSLIIFFSSIISVNANAPWIQLLTDKPEYVQQCDDISLTVLTGNFTGPQTIHIAISAYKYQRDFLNDRLDKITEYTLHGVQNGDLKTLTIDASGIGVYLNPVQWIVLATDSANADHNREIVGFVKFNTRMRGIAEGCPGTWGTAPGKKKTVPGSQN